VLYQVVLCLLVLLPGWLIKIDILYVNYTFIDLTLLIGQKEWFQPVKYLLLQCPKGLSVGHPARPGLTLKTRQVKPKPTVVAAAPAVVTFT